MPSAFRPITGHWSPSPRRQLAQHRNPGIELVYLKKGSVEWTVDGQVWLVPPGSLFFTLPWQLHGGLRETQRGIELFFIIIPTRPARLASPAKIGLHHALGCSQQEETRIVSTLANAPRPFVPARSPLPSLLPRLHAVNTSDDPCRSFLLAAHARSALLETSSLVAHNAIHPSSDFAHQVVREFLRQLRDRCAEPWTLDRMARQAGFGRTRFANLVGELTGDSPIRHLNRLRVEHASELLARSSLSITEIAHRLGFCDAPYFSRVFKAFTGQTASTFRSGQKGFLGRSSLGSPPHERNPDNAPRTR